MEAETNSKSLVYKVFPKVAIIILNWNSWKDTIECLESVFRIDYPNYQVIVVDNGSENDSVERIKTWADGRQEVLTPEPTHSLYRLSHPPVQKPIPYIEYDRKTAEAGGIPERERLLSDKLPKNIPYPLILIETGENLGFAGGNNVGIRYAMAENDFDSVILLNNDTVIRRETISNLVNARIKFGDKAIYGGRIFYYSVPNKIWYDGGKFNEWTGRSVHLNKGKLENEIKNESQIKEVNFITFCYVLIPKFILENIGLLDESYFMYVEDLDYSYRVWKSGYKLYNINSAEVWHKVGASSGEDEVNEFSAYWYYKNSLKVRYKIKKIKKITSIIFYFTTRPAILLKYLIKKPSIIKPMVKGIWDEIKWN